MKCAFRVGLCFFLASAVTLFLISCGEPSNEPEPSAASETDAQKLNQEIRKARQLLDEGKPEEAIAGLESFARQEPSLSPLVLLNIASFRMALNQPDQALEAINRGLSESPGMEPLLLMRGRIFQGIGRNREAAESFQEAASQHPDSSESHYQYGQFLYASGQWIEAASEFQAGLNIKPDHGPGQFQMAVALNKLGRNDVALSAARRAAELLPNELTVHRFYQDLAIAMGRRADVISDYFNLVEQNSQSGLHQYLYGRVLDDPEAAQFRFELAAHHAPDAFWPLLPWVNRGNWPGKKFPPPYTGKRRENNRTGSGPGGPLSLPHRYRRTQICGGGNRRPQSSGTVPERPARLCAAPPDRARTHGL